MKPSVPVWEPPDRALQLAPGPERAPADRAPWSGSVVLLTVSALVLFAVEGFFASHWSWFRPFLRDFWRWIRDPRVTGGWQAPTRPLLAVAIFAIAGILGWLAARLLLRGTAFAAERTLAGGLAITLGVCVIGYGGMLGVVFGLLSAQALLAFYALVAAVLGGLTIRTRRRERGDVVDEDRTRPAPRPLKVLTAAFAALVLALTLSHAALAPVQEWDAIVYHAENAKLWFQERPAPPVIYGPSVGIEISANYPPLFSASGAAIYTLLGRFDDLYLRVLPPLLFLSILLMTYGYARRRFGEDTACYATLLLLGTPLMLFYGVWTTGYILMAALVLATVVLSDMAAQAGSPARWAIAGAVAGLALLSHFYGVVAIPAGLAAIVIHRRRGWLGPALFLAVALAVASPWLLRNLILLHDPFYPLGSPPFHGKGLVQPLWEASKSEIGRNALGYWGVRGVRLRIRELTTALFDRHLLPMGLYFGLLLGLSMWRRQPVMAYLALVLSGLILLVLLPGWFWLRALVPAVPIAALLTGRLFAALVDAGKAGRGSRWPGLRPIARVAAVAAVTVSLAAGELVGLSLAIAGPNQYTWTTSLTSYDNLMRSVETLGSTREQLWMTFSGDSLMWEWLNQHVGPRQRVATLDIRTYYLDRPQDIFYLDGIEAVPLLHLDRPDLVEQYLLQQDVRYVALPSWSVDGPTRHPVVGILPLFRFLGTERFPAVAVFPVGASDRPSIVYAVGPTSVPPTLGVFPGGGSPAPALNDPSVTFGAGRVDPRIFVPTPQKQASALTFRYDTSGSGGFSVNLYDQTHGRWAYGVLRGTRTGEPGWGTATLPLPPTRYPYLDFGVYVSGTDLGVSDIRLVSPTDPLVRGANEIFFPGGGVGYRFAPGDVLDRIFVPVGKSGRTVLRFQYSDGRGGPFDVNVQDPVTGRWRKGVVTTERTDSGSWKRVQLTLTSARPGFVAVGVFVRGTDLVVQGLRAVQVP